MVKYHSDIERPNPLPPHGLLFPISSKGSFICTTFTYMIAHTTAFDTPVVEHWLEREIAQWTMLLSPNDQYGTCQNNEVDHSTATLTTSQRQLLQQSPRLRLLDNQIKNNRNKTVIKNKSVINM